MKSLSRITIALSIAALAAQIASAQPTGSISKQITGSTNSLWDFSRLTNELQQLDLNIEQGSGENSNAVEILYADPFMQDGRGRLSGSGTTVETLIQYPTPGHDAATTIFDTRYITSGSVRSSKGAARLTFTSRASGETALSQGGTVRLISVTATFTVAFDANNNLLTGRSVMRGAASGHGSISESSTIAPHPILPDMEPELGNGTWTLVLNFGAANGNKLTGTATVTLNSGPAYGFVFTGAFAPRSGQSKLSLKGVDAAKGSILTVILQDSQITRIVGQVSGQSIAVKQ